jgi:hypothetical protein
MTEFEKVSDDLRRRRFAGWAMYGSLLAGETIFVPSNGRNTYQIQGAVRSAMRRHSHALHYYTTEHNGVAGLVMWAAPKDATTERRDTVEPIREQMRNTEDPHRWIARLLDEEEAR